MRIILGLLSEDQAKVNKATKPDWSWRPLRTSPQSAMEVIPLMDKYDIPNIYQRFVEKLWMIACQNKEQALIVFMVAYQDRNVPLARHAMRHFKDMCHPIRFSHDFVSNQLYGGVWWFLIRVLYDHREEPVDWANVADKVVYPAE